MRLQICSFDIMLKVITMYTACQFCYLHMKIFCGFTYSEAERVNLNVCVQVFTILLPLATTCLLLPATTCYMLLARQVG